MDRHIVAVVEFFDLTINAKRLKDLAITPPRVLFEVEIDNNGVYHSNYPEVEESFRGNTIPEIVEQLRTFHESDACVVNVGKANVRKIKIQNI